MTKTPPNGESFIKFRNRVDKATKIMLEESKSNNILIVSHLQTLRMIKFCILETDNYEIWHNINYTHGEIIKEAYGKK